MLDTIKKFVPKKVWDRVRAALVFRPEDPLNFSQMPPQMQQGDSVGRVERIKGFRYPAPGSRTGAKVPRRKSEDDVYDTNHFKHDPDNLPIDAGYALIGSEKTVEVSLAKHRGKTHGKRKITLLPYDPSGLRTTKTATWEALDKVLAANAKPNHLPTYWWQGEIEAIDKDREAKGLPPAIGKYRNIRGSVSASMYEAKW